MASASWKSRRVTVLFAKCDVSLTSTVRPPLDSRHSGWWSNLFAYSPTFYTKAWAASKVENSNDLVRLNSVVCQPASPFLEMMFWMTFVFISWSSPSQALLKVAYLASSSAKAALVRAGFSISAGTASYYFRGTSSAEKLREGLSSIVLCRRRFIIIFIKLIIILNYHGWPQLQSILYSWRICPPKKSF